MDTQEHLRLVNVVRNMHRKLRKAFVQSNGDFETVWQNHLCAYYERKEYARAVLKLATEKWTMKDSRIHWCYKTCLDYFFRGGLEQSISKEMRCKLRQPADQTGDAQTSNSITSDCSVIRESLFFSMKLKLLDVGSCYNPFGLFKEFLAVPIDLTPATEDVFECDFSQLKVTNSSVEEWRIPQPPAAICELPGQLFHVVVFSLLLEYIPSPFQRLMFFRKAWELLSYNGILLVVTPDSKSQHHNAPMMKSWKIAIESLGFVRFRYEKLKHLHCMAFRKCCKKLPDFMENNIDRLSELVYVPQDFREFHEDRIIIDRTPEEDEDVQAAFFELPLQHVDL